MGFYEDYVADGLCCQSCGALIDMDEPGYARLCPSCWAEEHKRTKWKRKRLLGKAAK